VLRAVLTHGTQLDAASDRVFADASLDTRDRAFAKRLTLTVLRRHGTLTHLLKAHLDRGWPKQSGPFQCIMVSAAAQLLLLDAPPHAVINIAVEQCRAHRKSAPFAKLANAVLRRLAETGPQRLETCDPADHDIPPWMRARWRAAYGADLGDAIARACLAEAPLDLTLNPTRMGGRTAEDWAENLAENLAENWAAQLDGHLIAATGSVRCRATGPVQALPGFDDGAWWVQDAAAAIPARLLGPVEGRRVLDVCAAPGGKTAQLASAGAAVTALDISSARIERLTANLERLGLAATTITADARSWQPNALFDAVLLDAPCSATGTIRRNPDILHNRTADQIAATAALQDELLAAVSQTVAPGGMLVFCTCSLEPEEGAERVDAFLSRHADFARAPVSADRDGLPAEWVTANGDLRTLPVHLPPVDHPGVDRPDAETGASPGGLDGFFAARLVRQS